MKKYLSLLLLFALLSSCSEEIQFNNPAFQTLKNRVFWRAQTYEAYLTSGGQMVIKGSLGAEQVQLQTASPEARTYIFGVDNNSWATFYNEFSEPTYRFTTQANSGSGEITITEYNKEANTISGTFKFVAENSDERDTANANVSFSEGVFYKVPITSEITFEN
ncbi:DUF6252 family protein [Flavobacterium hercynium]|uniref:Lipoprotein n=1 Tax=Flavobacterium hercynium TaxID=387094 RepID=A0A226HFX6_9FLAO|nr:DUF6252 family protein [Flavobacterium hercynium]OXA92758.1 hypothetical protein B0A66_08230 [Flavobacterium hercynium]SMP01714.1 hypothetical protein SAMN06265346_10173 [Flavobacterium hercynium]